MDLVWAGWAPVGNTAISSVSQQSPALLIKHASEDTYLKNYFLSRSVTPEATRIYQFTNNNHASIYLW